PLRGGNAGVHADRIDGDGERGAHGFGIVGGHHRDVELFQTFGGQGHTDQAAAVHRHEVDVPRLDFFCGHHQVAFVFPVFVVHDDHHAALADLLDGFFDG